LIDFHAAIERLRGEALKAFRSDDRRVCRGKASRAARASCGAAQVAPRLLLALGL